MNDTKDEKKRSLVDVFTTFAEAMQSCSRCPLDEFCNRSEEGRRYGTCAASATAWLKAHIDIERSLYDR